MAAAGLLMLVRCWRTAAVGPHNCGADVSDGDRPTDCAWRSLAVEYASKIVGPHAAPSVHDALEIERLCPGAAPRPHQVPKPAATDGAVARQDEGGLVLHVSPAADGQGDGSSPRSPLTLTQARDRVRGRGSTTDQASATRRPRPATVLLGAGIYYLNGTTLELGPEDSGHPDAPVVWAARPGEQHPPVISGAALLSGLRWARWQAAEGVWVAELPPDTPPFKSLYVSGSRYWPARWPNGDPRYDLFPDSYSTDCVWGDDMAEADGLPFVGGSRTDLCSQPGSTSVGVPCYRNNTHFPDSPWFEGGWSCRFQPCEGCADYGDHYKCMHGQMQSGAFNKSWAHPAVAAVDVLHGATSVACF
jgi:hypothetical protein